MPVTTKDIARVTGLSVPTVGNVLGGASHRYSRDTVALIRRVADQLGYRPNASARAMRSGRFGNISLILSRPTGQCACALSDALLDGLDEELAEQNMTLTLSRVHEAQLTGTAGLPKPLQHHMADGVIMHCTHAVPAAFQTALSHHQIPTVWMNLKLDQDCVRADEHAAGHLAVDALRSFGHRRILWFHPRSPIGTTPFEEAAGATHYSATDRLQGYVQAMTDAGLSPEVLGHDRFIPEADHEAVLRQHLGRAGAPDRPTAVIVYDADDTSAVLGAARTLGLSVPRDLSVINFHTAGCWALGKFCSHVRIPSRTVGREAVRMLMRRIDQPAAPQEPVVLPVTLVLEQTTAAPGGGVP